jgi:hypothetical protein
MRSQQFLSSFTKSELEIGKFETESLNGSGGVSDSDVGIAHKHPSREGRKIGGCLCTLLMFRMFHIAARPLAQLGLPYKRVLLCRQRTIGEVAAREHQAADLQLLTHLLQPQTPLAQTFTLNKLLAKN